jgi:hypothetical protein
MSERFTIRLATPEDVDAIAEHRARMFDEIGQVPPDAFEILRAKSRERLRDLVIRGEYIGWLAIPRSVQTSLRAGPGFNSARFCRIRSRARPKETKSRTDGTLLF